MNIKMTTHTEIAAKADFSTIRYAQCWEDADILLEALDIQPGDTCLSIASAGDNTLAMLTQSPARVIAIDLSPAQLACLELRVAAYRQLSHHELLELIGSRASHRREMLYRRCRLQLSTDVQAFWDARPAEIAAGIGSVGKFERYFSIFRRRMLPLIHSQKHVARMLAGGAPDERRRFYSQNWNTWRWQLIFRLFFSRLVMGYLGRDRSFFQYVEGRVADQILKRTQYAATTLNPAENPYLQWILTGRHTTALPYALRPENFEVIRANLDRLEWRCQSLEDFLDQQRNTVIDRYNLSDIFEYMSPENHHHLLHKLIRAGRSGTRLVYWNMLTPRSRPQQMAHQIRPLAGLARRLHRIDKAFFYSNFVVEEII
jgi:S-adenosylmethionine-diacylglycerol 3-amino-3-carboxypropyl transferase